MIRSLFFPFSDHGPSVSTRTIRPDWRVLAGLTTPHYPTDGFQTGHPDGRMVQVGGLEEYALGLQPYPQKVVRPPKPTLTIFSGGGWSPRDGRAVEFGPLPSELGTRRPNQVAQFSVPFSAAPAGQRGSWRQTRVRSVRAAASGKLRHLSMVIPWKSSSTMF